MTEGGAPLSFCRILAPPPHDSKILYYRNDRDEGRYYFYRILAPPPPPMSHPLPLTPQYLTILMTERGGAIIFVGFCVPQSPPPPDATILNYLTHREGRRALPFVGFWRPSMPTLPLP